MRDIDSVLTGLRSSEFADDAVKLTVAIQAGAQVESSGDDGPTAESLARTWRIRSGLGGNADEAQRFAQAAKFFTSCAGRKFSLVTVIGRKDCGAIYVDLSLEGHRDACLTWGIA